MKHVMMGVAVLLAFASDAFAEDFRWNFAERKGHDCWEAKSLPEKGAYTVRFRAALTSVGNGFLLVNANGVEFRNQGDGFEIIGQKNPAYKFTMRNRRYHDLVFVCREKDVQFIGDGDEYPPVSLSAEAKRGFSIFAQNADLDVAGLELAPGDLAGTWTSRNQAMNGGFEELCNDYAIGWSTHNFGFFDVDDILDLERCKRKYHIDETVAYEGRRSMFVDCDKPVWECWRKRFPDTEYVVSAYVRSDVPGTRVAVSLREGYVTLGHAEVEAGPKWKRVEAKVRTRSGDNVGCVVSRVAGGRFWVDAIQLERGSRATPYVTRHVPEEAVQPDPPAVMDRYYCGKPSPQPLPNGKPYSKRVDARRNSYRFGDKEYFSYGFCGLMGVTDVAKYEKLMALYEKWGFNFYEWCVNAKYTTDPTLARQMLDAAERHGIKTVIHLRHVSSSAFEEKELALVKAVADHPNLLAVGILDETYSHVRREDAEALTRKLRAELPCDVPIRFNEFDLGVINHAQNSEADIASGDFYVIGEQEVSTLYYALKLLKDDHPDQLVSYFPMAAGHFFRWLRDPTPDEVVAQAYMGYVQEIFNVTWWMAAPLTWSKVIPAMSQAKRELDRIGPSAFLDGEPYGVTCASRNDAVKFAARFANGRATIIAINIENRPNDATWTLPAPVKGVQTIIGKPCNRPKGAVLRESFGPLERRVYEVRL